MFMNAYLVFVAWARVICLICAPWDMGAAGPGAGGVHVGWAMGAHVWHGHGWSAWHVRPGARGPRARGLRVCISGRP